MTTRISTSDVQEQCASEYDFWMDGLQYANDLRDDEPITANVPVIVVDTGDVLKLLEPPGGKVMRGVRFTMISAPAVVEQGRPPSDR